MITFHFKLSPSYSTKLICRIWCIVQQCVLVFYNKQITWNLCTSTWLSSTTNHPVYNCFLSSTTCLFVYHKAILYTELCEPPYALFVYYKAICRNVCTAHPYSLLYTTNLYVELFVQLYPFVYHEANLVNFVYNLMAFRVPPNAFSSATKLIHV
jgi:hypothetical protein